MYLSFYLTEDFITVRSFALFQVKSCQEGTFYKNFHSHLLPLLIHVSHTFKTASFSLEKWDLILYLGSKSMS